jgi:hypothetical protein
MIADGYVRIILVDLGKASTCRYGGAGMPYPYCNMSDELSPPRLLSDFKVDVESGD